MDIRAVARVCHEANRAYCLTLCDHSQPSWDEAPDWQQKSCVRGVLFIIEHPNADFAAQHDHWVSEKLADGWEYGAINDPVRRTHPSMLPWESLPRDEQAKDRLFHAIVKALWRG